MVQILMEAGATSAEATGAVAEHVSTGFAISVDEGPSGGGAGPSGGGIGPSGGGIGPPGGGASGGLGCVLTFGLGC